VFAYIVRRLLMLPVVLFFSTLLIFFFMQFLSPTVRVSLYVQQSINLARFADELIRRYGLDRPIWEQWANWIGAVFQGNLGFSKTVQMPVLDALLSFLPATIELTLAAIFPMILGGIWFGVVAAKHQNKPIDHTSRVISVVGWSLPNFVLGLFLLMIFFGYLGWVSDGRLSVESTLAIRESAFIRHTGMFTVDALLNGRWDIFWDALAHLVLPALTLAFVSFALIVRVMRSSMLNELREDYVTTARAKGLPEKVVIHEHARRNAMIPVVTLSGLLTAGLLSGVVITETVVNFRGLGQWFARAAINLDFPAVLGLTLFSGVLIVVTNLIVDVLYALIDPRIRLE